MSAVKAVRELKGSEEWTSGMGVAETEAGRPGQYELSGSGSLGVDHYDAHAAVWVSALHDVLLRATLSEARSPRRLRRAPSARGRGTPPPPSAAVFVTRLRGARCLPPIHLSPLVHVSFH